MMNRGEFQSSLVQQMVWSSGGGGGTNNTNIMSSSLRPCPHEEQEASLRMPPLSSPSALFSQQLPHISAGLAPSLHDGQEGSMPAESWSQLLLGGLVGDHERYSTTALLSKGLENWGDQGASASSMVDVKEESSMAHAAAYSFYGHGNTGHEEIQAAGANKPQLSQMLLASSPRSCITTNFGSSMLDFSNGAPPELRNHHSDNSSECNSTAAAGSALKKARVQASSSAQSTLKVRKERLGDRITALHQIVSPFGKTDTASVLQETIGYVRFLLGQIEALSYPYLGHGTAGNSMQTGPAGERSSGRFPENPGQLLNNASAQAGQSDQQGANNGEARKDLRSRGLCLVPVSCTSHFGGDNGSDIWAPAPLGGILR